VRRLGLNSAIARRASSRFFTVSRFALHVRVLLAGFPHEYGAGRRAECGQYRPFESKLNMSQSGSQAWAFYREVARSRTLWTVGDDVGYPAPKTASGQRAQPFWSSRSRAEKIIATVPAYSTFHPEAISWGVFCKTWIADMERDGLLVGINWSGPRAVGFDFKPFELQRNVEALILDPDLSAG
jgi:hypothetical protein